MRISDLKILLDGKNGCIVISHHLMGMGFRKPFPGGKFELRSTRDSIQLSCQTPAKK